ncbi:MAG: hypothetical protein ACLFR5_01645 [Halobacteriales archaeon]
MDKKKLVLVIGLCLVLAGALSGCVDSTQDNNDTDADGDGTDGGAGTNGGDGGGDNGEDDGDNGTTAEEIDVDTSNMSAECDVQGSTISPEETEDVDSVYSRIGPPFDERQAEAMLHEELNQLRTTHGNDSVEPLLCDPNLREIAQEHSRVMEELEFIGPEVPDDKMPEDRNVTTNPEYGNLSVRYEGVCREPVETYGRWLYQRNKNLDWESDGRALHQRDRVDVISDHEELVRDMRGVWFSDRDELSPPLKIAELRRVEDGEASEESTEETIEYLDDGNYTRQGIGMHIDRETREVYVTQVLC